MLNQYRNLICLMVLFVCSSRAQQTTLHPGEECLPPDGSTIPDCREYVNPATLEPVFIEHSYNCSRFYICGPDYEFCLNECAPMPEDEDGNRSLFFDKNIQYPVGPVCNWPAVIDCENKPPPSCNPDECPGVQCNECTANDVCTNYECCTTSEDDDCVDPNKPICSDHVCIAGCRADPECPGFDQVCDQTNSNCQWCDNSENNIGSCKPGCINDDNCPEFHECNNHQCEETGCQTDDDCVEPDKPLCDNHVCVAGCRDDPGCPGFDEICDANNSNCQWCDNPNNEIGGCKPGCIDNDNCPEFFECNDHQCEETGCQTDDDCVEDDAPLCENHVCVPGCRVDSQCPGYNSVCNAAYDNCFYCNSTDNNIGSCNPGCIDNSNCPASLPECNGEHLCVDSGVTTLKGIMFTTASCSGCSGTPVEQGLILHMYGEEGIDGEIPMCSTNNLDHEDTVDYDAGVVTVFSTDNQEDRKPLGTCFKKNLRSVVEGGTAMWTDSTGSWTPQDQQFEVMWSDPQKRNSCCCLDKPAVVPGDAVSFGRCSSCPTTCP